MFVSFEEFLNRKDTASFLEMAYRAGNVSKLPYLFGREDMEFLHQFPPVFWPAALQWRYRHGLMEAMKLHDEGKEIPDPQKVQLKIWGQKGGTYNVLSKIVIFDNIKTGFAEMIDKLQRATEAEWLAQRDRGEWGDWPGGPDYDLSDPGFGTHDPNTGEPILHRDPPDIFNTTMLAMQYETARKNIRAMAKATELGLWGSEELPDEFMGQKTTRQDIQVGGERGEKTTYKNIPAYKRKYTYIEIPQGGKKGAGKPKTVTKELVVPVFVPGVILKPVPTNKIQALITLFGLTDVHPSLNALGKVRLLDQGRTVESIIKALREHKSELRLSDKWIEAIHKWLQNPGSPEFKSKKGKLIGRTEDLTMANLARAVNPLYTRQQWGAPPPKGRETIAREPANVLNNWDLLSDEDKEILSQRHGVADIVHHRAQDTGEFRTHQDYWMIGGWEAHSNIPVATPLDSLDISDDEKKKWIEQVREEIQRAMKQWEKTFTGGEALKRQYEVNRDEMADAILDFFVRNGGHPSYGIRGSESSRSNKTKALLSDMVKSAAKYGVAGGGFDYGGSAGDDDEFDPDTGEIKDDEGEEDLGSGGAADAAAQRAAAAEKEIGTGKQGKRRFFQKGLGDFSGNIVTAVKGGTGVSDKTLHDRFEEIDKIYQSLLQQAPEGSSPEEAEAFADEHFGAALSDAGIELSGNFVTDYKMLKKQKQSGDAQTFAGDVKNPAEEELITLATDKQAQLSMGGGMLIDLDRLKGMGAQANVALDALKKYFVDQGVPEEVLAKYWPMIQNYVMIPETVYALDQKLKILSEIHLAVVNGHTQFLENPEMLERIQKLGKYLEAHPVPSRRQLARTICQDIMEMAGTGVVTGTGTDEKKKKYIRSHLGNDANVWGALGDPEGVWPGKYKIKKSLKEHLELEPYRKRLENRLNAAKLA